MRSFNALQMPLFCFCRMGTYKMASGTPTYLVSMFAGLPLAMEWVKTQSFVGSGVAFYVMGAAYIVMFFGLCFAVRVAMGGK